MIALFNFCLRVRFDRSFNFYFLLSTASQFGDPIPVEVTFGQIAPDVVGTGHKTQLYQKTYLARESNKELLPTAKCHPNTSLLRTLVTRS